MHKNLLFVVIVALLPLLVACGKVSSSLVNSNSQSEDATPKVAFQQPSTYVTFKEGEAFDFAIILDKKLPKATQVKWMITPNQNDFAVASGELSLDKGSNSFSFQLNAIADGVVEGPEEFTISITENYLKKDTNDNKDKDKEKDKVFSNEVSFKILVLDSETLGSFNISGVTGGTDTTADNILTDGSIATLK